MSELGERGQRLLAALVARDKTLDDPANPLREVRSAHAPRRTGSRGWKTWPSMWSPG